LEESERDFRTLFENTPNILAIQRVIRDSSGEVVDFEFLAVNNAFLEQTGFTEEEVVGRKVTEVYPGIESSYIDWIQAVGVVVSSGQTLRVEALMEAYNRWYQITSYKAKEDEVVTVFTDIHEMKMAETSLRAEKEKAETYLDIAGVMFIALDQDGIVTMVNQSGAEILGCPQEEIIGLNWFEEFVPSDLSQDLKELHQGIIKGEIAGIGTYVNPVLTKSGELRVIEWRNIQLKDEEDNINGVLSSGTDITEMREVQQVIQAERDRALLYLDLMSHDIRNNLQAILGSAETISQLSELQNIDKLTKLIIDASNKCSSIIEKIRKTELLRSVPLEKTQLNPVLVQTIKDFSEEYKDVEIIMNRAVTKAEILADEFLDDMLYTLLENAVTHNQSEEKQIWLRVYQEHDGFAIVVSDNGSGLTEHQKDVLFDVEKRIAGVGLHQVRQILEKYKGRITVNDRITGKPNAGAEFRVWIPKV
jgi:PAS domain S-box-containing protein